MALTKTFAEGLYAFWCTVREYEAEVFVCTITFATIPSRKPIQTAQFNLDDAFASAEEAMQAGERRGRNMIRLHGDVIHHLAQLQ